MAKKNRHLNSDPAVAVHFLCVFLSSVSIWQDIWLPLSMVTLPFSHGTATAGTHPTFEQWTFYSHSQIDFQGIWSLIRTGGKKSLLFPHSNCLHSHQMDVHSSSKPVISKNFLIRTRISIDFLRVATFIRLRNRIWFFIDTENSTKISVRLIQPSV